MPTKRFLLVVLFAVASIAVGTAAAEDAAPKEAAAFMGTWYGSVSDVPFKLELTHEASGIKGA
jgi:hypothetical protein